MPLHNAKRVAFLQLCNWVSSSDLADIEDLLDGEFFENILSTVFEIWFNAEKCDSAAAVSENDKISSEELKMLPESGDVETKHKISSEELKTLPESEDAESKNKIISEKFKFIQNFIDERYNIDSDKLISYSACAQGKELELAKVTIFILSEVVGHYAHTNNDHLKTLAHLDVKVQEDLQECFHLFIFERDNLSKSKVEKVLSNHARYKAPSPSKSCFVTPRRSCSSKYRMNSTANEDVFTNSPLKSFFESPIFKKEDIKLKEKEIIKTRNNLHKEEIKCDELQLQLNDAKRKLKEKDIEIKKLKANKIKVECDENLQEVTSYKEEIKQLKASYARLKKESKKMEKNYEAEMSELCSTITKLKYKASEKSMNKSYSEPNETLQKLLFIKDLMLEKQNAKLEHFRLKIKELEDVIKMKDNDNLDEILKMKGDDYFTGEIKRKNEELSEWKDAYYDLQATCMAKERLFNQTLDDIKRSRENDTSTEENMGMILEEENRNLHLKVKELEEQLLQQTEMVRPETIHIPNIENAFNVSVPELLNEADPLETQKLKDLKKQSKNDEELTGLPDECDFSSNSEVASKHSAVSSHSEVKCSPDSSLTENTPEPESYDSQGNLLNKSCCNCNKIHLESESMKMAREHAIQLEMKDDEIDKLKANLETLQQEYFKELEANKKTIEELQSKLAESNETYKRLYTRASEYKESLLSEREKLKNHNEVCEKLRMMKFEVEKKEKLYKEEVQTLKVTITKQTREKIFLKGEISNSNRAKNALDKRICVLESQMEHIVKCFKELKEDYTKKTQELEKIKTRQREDRRRKQMGLKPPSFYIEYDTGSSKDICNESTLSGALCSKNGFQFISQDEADFLNQSSLEEIHKHKEDRLGEILKRNSILPQHLKSSYPTEMNLSLSSEKFYRTQIDQTVKIENSDETEYQNGQINKKRKHLELEPDVQSELACTTPAKMKRFNAPESLRKLMKYARNSHKGAVKPKPT